MNLQEIQRHGGVGNPPEARLNRQIQNNGNALFLRDVAINLAAATAYGLAYLSMDQSILQKLISHRVYGLENIYYISSMLSSVRSARADQLPRAMAGAACVTMGAILYILVKEQDNSNEAIFFERFAFFLANAGSFLAKAGGFAFGGVFLKAFLELTTQRWQPLI